MLVTRDSGCTPATDRQDYRDYREYRDYRDYRDYSGICSMKETQRIFLGFFIFGLLNNILYVVILSAAIDLVGPSTPKAVVLLADILPSLTIKILAPFFIHVVPYGTRIWILVVLSFSGMLIVSLTSKNAIAKKVVGISLASLSSGMGELSFLQLTHFYDEKCAIGGFSSGSGGAGLLGSFLFLLLTNIVGIPTWGALLSFAIAPLGILFAFFYLIAHHSRETAYQILADLNVNDDEMSVSIVTEPGVNDINMKLSERASSMLSYIRMTLKEIYPLFWPFMLPLCTVYVGEYTINQGISPTLLFPLDEIPSWLIKKYRDIYVLYGFLYQLGVFISRSSVSFGFRVRQLYVLSLLQMINVGITLMQSLYDFPFSSVWLLLFLIFYEGLLGGLLYVNTFMSVSEQVEKDRREFAMGSVGISDSFGIMVAGFISLWLETSLCDSQVNRGRNWCRTGGP